MRLAEGRGELTSEVSEDACHSMNTRKVDPRRETRDGDRDRVISQAKSSSDCHSVGASRPGASRNCHVPDSFSQLWWRLVERETVSDLLLWCVALIAYKPTK